MEGMPQAAISKRVEPARELMSVAAPAASLMDHLIILEEPRQGVQDGVVDKFRALGTANHQNYRNIGLQFEVFNRLAAGRWVFYFRPDGLAGPGHSLPREIIRRIFEGNGNPFGETAGPLIHSAGRRIGLVDKNGNREKPGGENGRKTGIAALAENHVRIN